jgi:hypothetical protein
MEAKVGTNPSFIWRSILKARKTIAKGMRWKIRNGKSVNVWQDKWLHFTPVCKQDDNNIVMVKDLIDEDIKWWNEPLIDEVFYSNMVAAIKRIQLSHLNSNHQSFWGETLSREFIVSSTYEMLMKIDNPDKDGESSNAVEVREAWQKIWKLNISSKVKHFLWRACSATLPTKHNLYKRQIIDNPSCVFNGDNA